MNTNVGEMPLEIYADYCTEQCGVEFSYLHFFLPTLNFYNHWFSNVDYDNQRGCSFWEAENARMVTGTLFFGAGYAAIGSQNGNPFYFEKTLKFPGYYFKKINYGHGK